MWRKCSIACSARSAWASSGHSRSPHELRGNGGEARDGRYLVGARANCPGHPAFGDRAFHQATAQVITSALGEHVLIDGARLVAQPIGQIAEAKAEPCA